MDRKGLFDEISRLAYELFKKRGGIQGEDLDDWFAAERIVIESYSESKDSAEKETGPT